LVIAEIAAWRWWGYRLGYVPTDSPVGLCDPACSAVVDSESDVAERLHSFREAIMTDYPQGPVETVEAGPVPQQMAPHRGTLILVLGIVGIVCCFIGGIVAWVMANTDLREMDAGRMDPDGRGLTLAGKICGIVSIVLFILGLLYGILMMVLVGAGAFPGAM
jgi:hypothetical protein